VLGHGGNGITFGRIAAEIIATDLGGGVFDADLFAG
jgi:glycine/D-amino acid oxidase-like deaminating enzyme